MAQTVKGDAGCTKGGDALNIQPKERIDEFLAKYQCSFKTPQVYLGKEANAHRKVWDAFEYKILLAWPIRYEDSRGNQTLPLLYEMLNDVPGVLCDRAYFPNSESDYKLFRKCEMPIFGLESRRSMGEYDMIMTSLSFLPPWVNFPLMLEMSGIPASNNERLTDDETYPLVMIGGSAMYGNFSIAYPVVDIIYFGDAELGLAPLMAYLMPDDKRARALQNAQENLDYIMVPYFYEPVYDGDKFKEWVPIRDKYPKKLRTIKVSDLNRAPTLKAPPISYTDTTMGLGEVEISRGCRGTCVYCGIGWKYRPYRERSRETMVRALLENRRLTGATALCPIATEFAYYSEKRGLFNDLIQHCAVVDPLSMRVDAFAKDEPLMRALSDSGMNQLAIGVEAPSQRLRNRLMKGITEEDIFTACKIAIESGLYKRIKFFMISNIDETWEDFEELFALIKRVVAEILHHNSSIRLKVSWTPLFVEPCTPIQWKKPTIEQRQPWRKVADALDDCNPKDEDGKIIKKIVYYPPGGGGKHEENFLWLMQGMHLGDTRFANALLQTTIQQERPYYVSFAKSMKEVLTERLEGQGLSWSSILRERASDEVFPWDIVDRGVTKNALFNIYTKYIKGFLDNKVQLVKSVVDETPLSLERSSERSVEYWYLCEYLSNSSTIPNTYWEAVLHRAAYIQKFPIAPKSIHFFSDRANRNWFSGFDFFHIGTRESVDEQRIKDLSNVIDDFVILNVRPSLKMSFNKMYSRYDVVLRDIRYKELKKKISEFEAQEKVIVLVPETRYFSGERKKKVNIKDGKLFRDLRFVMDDDFTTLRVYLNEKLGIRYFLSGLLPNKSWKKILSYSVEKSGLFMYVEQYDALVEMFK